MIGQNRRGSFVAVAQSLLLALSEGRNEAAWEHAKALAEAILDDPMNVIAKGILGGEPFAMRRAEELAEVVLDEESDPEELAADLTVRAATSSQPS